MFCIITNETETNLWLTSVALDQLITVEMIDLGHVRPSSQWRGKRFLIEHVVNVKTLNGSEHDGQSFKRYGCYAFTGGREYFIFFFLLKLKILDAKVKFWCGTQMT